MSVIPAGILNTVKEESNPFSAFWYSYIPLSQFLPSPQFLPQYFWWCGWEMLFFSSNIPHSWGSQALTQHYLFICKETGIVQLSPVLCHLEGEEMLTKFNLTFQMLSNACFCSNGVLQSFIRKDGLLKILSCPWVSDEAWNFQVFPTTSKRSCGQFTGSS